jgi:hypothetical protein
MARRDVNGTIVKDGWSTNVTLETGTGSGLGTEPIAQPKGKIQSLQVNFPFSGDFTVEFSLQPLEGPSPGNPAVYMAEAIVDLVCEGNLVRRRVSIANGTTLTGVAEGIKVIMWDTTPNASSAAYGSLSQVGLKYNVSVQVALGTRPGKNTQPQLTPGPDVTNNPANNDAPGFFFVAGAHGSIEVPIPKDAGITSIMALVTAGFAQGDSLSTEGAVVELVNSVGGFTMAAWYPLLTPGIWIPVPAGADTVVLQNLAAASNGTTFYTLFFAIDG